MNTITINNNPAVRPVVTVLFLLAVMLLSACATTSTTESPEDIVQQRAQARWDALLARDYAGAYAFYSPGYRSTTSATDLEIDLRMRRVRWTSADFLKCDCAENTCTARFNLGYRVNSPVPGVDTWNGFDVIQEQWVKTNGVWWYLPENK